MRHGRQPHVGDARQVRTRGLLPSCLGLTDHDHAINTQLVPARWNDASTMPIGHRIEAPGIDHGSHGRSVTAALIDSHRKLSWQAADKAPFSKMHLLFLENTQGFVLQREFVSGLPQTAVKLDRKGRGPPIMDNPFQAPGNSVEAGVGGGQSRSVFGRKKTRAATQGCHVPVQKILTRYEGAGPGIDDWSLLSGSRSVAVPTRRRVTQKPM